MQSKEVQLVQSIAGHLSAIPTLKAVGKGPWERFCREFEVYKLQGGDKRMSTLITSEVVIIYSYEIQAFEDEEQFRNLTDEQFNELL